MQHVNRFGKPAHIRAAYCKTKDGYLARAAVQYEGETFKNGGLNAFHETSAALAVEQAMADQEKSYRRLGVEPPPREKEKARRVSHYLLMRDVW